jgi:hypothetical protein
MRLRRHEHNWAQRYVYLPPKNLARLQDAPRDVAELLLYGETIQVLACRLCPKVKTEKVGPGDLRPAGYERW